MSTGFTSLDTFLICRMGSSRLSGKTLLPFGEGHLLEHIVTRLISGGIERKKIVITTSDLHEDRMLEDASKKMGCRFFAGSSQNVSKRIIAAAQHFKADNFLLVLGDNPWIDPRQVREISQPALSFFDYVVTATPELETPWPKVMYPTGTRLQRVSLKFLNERYAKFRNRETEEHVSKLFARLSPSSLILEPDIGFPSESIQNLNVSINTNDDYVKALNILNKIGPAASIRDVVLAYLNSSK